MKIVAFHIQNFKSIKDTKIFLEPSVNVLTGVNNCGKTTILEALALWVECFEKLIHQAKRSVTGKYNAGDYVLASSNRYFDFDTINSVRSPNFEDIFYDKDVRKPIRLAARLRKQSGQELRIPFYISNSTKSRYVISLEEEALFNYQLFNAFFAQWPSPMKAYFSVPLANIEQQEIFVTNPVLQESLRQRRSFEIVRNRLYKLYHTSYFEQFQKDLSYVLYGPSIDVKLKFFSRSDVNHDTRVLITYIISGETIEKDMALLGSGTLQAIEILLNIYNEVNGNHDLNIILLDEPDSHIHRDIQTRLFEILNRERINTQIIITTHNESMIRTVPLSNLYHVDVNQPQLVCVGRNELEKINMPHFRWVYPALETPIILGIHGDATGLDLIGAIEAEKIVFVEGDDDARLLFNLFYKRPSNRGRKLMFWVLGGVSRILTKVEGYYDVFSSIRNGRSLWDKSLLVFDQDWMSDNHIAFVKDKLAHKFQIKSHVAHLYTQESVLLTDLGLLAFLIARKFDFSEDKIPLLIQALSEECDRRLPGLRQHQLSNEEHRVRQYIGQYIIPMNSIFDGKFSADTLHVDKELKDYYNLQPIHKLATKEDVAVIINAASKAVGMSFEYDTEKDFYSLVNIADATSLFNEWSLIIDFLSE